MVYGSQVWQDLQPSKSQIFNLPNARPVGCRSVTLLVYSFSFAALQHTHALTHAHTHTKRGRHTGVLGAAADVGGYLDVLDERGMVVKEYINATMMDVSGRVESNRVWDVG